MCCKTSPRVVRPSSYPNSQRPGTKKISKIIAKQNSQPPNITTPSKAQHQSFDLTASNRYLTSFNALVAGFQSSNCFSNSSTSLDSSDLTKSSSNRPRMIQGRWYGFGLERAPGWRVAMSQGMENLLVLGRAGEVGEMSVVSRA